MPLFIWAMNKFYTHPSGKGWIWSSLPLTVLGFFAPVLFCCLDTRRWWQDMKSVKDRWELTSYIPEDWLQQCIPAWGRMAAMIASCVISILVLKRLGFSF